MANLIGMLVGAAIDRGDGDSGIKGAVIGSLVQGVAKVAMPLAITAAVGYGVLRLVRGTAGRARNIVASEPNAKDIQVS